MKKVLIVDDSPLIRYAISSRLSLSGFRIDVCGTGRRAVELIRENNPDIVLLDINMPDGDGLYVLENARPSIYGYKCIVVSSLGRYDEKIVRALSLGAIDHVEKPDIRSLDGVISHIISILESCRVNVDMVSVLERIVLIIGSTGAPAVVDSIINLFQRPTRTAIVLVQHISERLSKAYVEYLGRKFPSVLATNVKVEPGMLYFVPGGHFAVYSFTHMIVAHPAENNLPGDLTGQGIAKNFKGEGIVVVLSGMGNDGEGAVESFLACGWEAYAQKPETCVVDSMPKNAIKRGAKAIHPHEVVGLIV